MRRHVLTFGLISGVIMSVLMDGSLLLADKIGSGYDLVLGYANMVASFLLISAAILRRKAPVEPSAAPAVIPT
jgi:uncharacterized protein involved in response to NO